MKIKAHEVDQFLKAPKLTSSAVLLYGPDQGLVRERSNFLAKKILGDLHASFGLTDLTDTDIKNDPARLADEVSAISMLADARVVRIQGASESTTSAVTSLIEGLSDGSIVAEALLIVEGGDLTPRSKLRSLFEKQKSTAALPCYADEGRTLQSLITKTLSAAGLTADPGALNLLMDRLGGDRGLTRNELEKLMLYKGVGTAGFTKGSVSQTDVEASLGLPDEANIDRVIDMALTGNFDGLDQALTSAYGAGANAIAILRALASHLDRLYIVRSQKERGGDLASAMKALRPPIFFKRQKAFSAQASRWPAASLQRALALALQAEIDCKKTGSSDQTICAHALMALASNARHQARR
jgi:DNA polymerase-3 subunit delta